MSSYPLDPRVASWVLTWDPIMGKGDWFCPLLSNQKTIGPLCRMVRVMTSTTWETFFFCFWLVFRLCCLLVSVHFWSQHTSAHFELHLLSTTSLSFRLKQPKSKFQYWYLWTGIEIGVLLKVALAQTYLCTSDWICISVPASAMTFALFGENHLTLRPLIVSLNQAWPLLYNQKKKQYW